MCIFITRECGWLTGGAIGGGAMLRLQVGSHPLPRVGLHDKKQGLTTAQNIRMAWRCELRSSFEFMKLPICLPSAAQLGCAAADQNAAHGIKTRLTWGVTWRKSWRVEASGGFCPSPSCWLQSKEQHFTAAQPKSFSVCWDIHEAPTSYVRR